MCFDLIWGGWWLWSWRGCLPKAVFSLSLSRESASTRKHEFFFFLVRLSPSSFACSHSSRFLRPYEMQPSHRRNTRRTTNTNYARRSDRSLVRNRDAKRHMLTLHEIVVDSFWSSRPMISILFSPFIMLINLELLNYITSSE